MKYEYFYRVMSSCPIKVENNNYPLKNINKFREGVCSNSPSFLFSSVEGLIC